MSASLVGWIVSIAFILILVAGFFVGFWRGLKRSTVSLVISIVGVVVAFFVTPAITKAILGIQITVNGEASTLHEVILTYITSIEGVDNLVEKNPNLETLFLNLPVAIVNVVLFLLVTVAVEGLLYVVYKILACTVFKVQEGEKKRRVTGGVVGVVKTLIVVLFAFMPFASLIGTAYDCTTAGDYGIVHSTGEEVSSQAILLEEGSTPEGENPTEDKKEEGLLPNSVIKIIDGLENNLLTKMSGVFGLDNALFDYYGSFDLDGKKIVLREEIANTYDVIDLSTQLLNINSDTTFKDFNYKKIATTLDKLTESPLFENVLAETLGEIIMNYKDYSFIADSSFAQENAQILDALSLGLKAYTEAGGSVSDYFTGDIKTIADVAMAFGEKGIIDEIFDLENMDADNIIIVLTKEGNYETLQSGLDSIFKMNIVRDALTAVMPKVTDAVGEYVDPIGVSTEEWKDEDWTSLSNSLAGVLKRYGNIAQKVSVLKVVEDATILLDKEENYDISGILNELGHLIDEARDVNLLQTTEEKPIVDKLLIKYNLTLPTENVIDGEGEEVTIENYNELMTFISPSLVKLRDEGLYEIITAGGDTNAKIESIAVIVSKEGNEKLFSEIIMPLYQVEPSKTLIVAQLSNGLSNDLIDLSTLTTYDDWKGDLDKISALLKTLNGKITLGKTFLNLALNGQFDSIIDALTEADVDPIILPAFYAKSTAGVREKVLSKLQNDFALMTRNANLTISAEGVTFEEGNEENQAVELSSVLKKLIPLKKSYTEALADLTNVDKTILGQTLETMKQNAYRVELASKTEEGIFKDTFIALMAQFKEEYKTEVAILEANPDTLENALGVRSLEEENYSKIDFTILLAMLAEMENQTA